MVLLKNFNTKTPLESKTKTSAGEYVAEGSYGCVFNPAFLCKGQKPENRYEGISKVFENRKEAKAEEKENEKIDQIDPKYRWHLKSGKVCIAEPTDPELRHLRNCGLRINTYLPINMLQVENGGMSLNSYLKSPRLQELIKSPYKTMRFLIQFKRLFYGVKDMIQKNMIHTDIKPDNIVYNPETERFNFIDFGLMCDVTNFNKSPGYRRTAIGYWVNPLDFIFMSSKYNNKKTDTISNGMRRAYYHWYMPTFDRKYTGSFDKYNGVYKLSYDPIMVEKNKNFLKSHPLKFNFVAETLDSYGLGITCIILLFTLTNKSYYYDKDLFKSGKKFNEILHYNLSKLIDSLCHPSLEERVTSVQSPIVYNKFIIGLLDKLETHNHITKSEKLELTNLNNNLMNTYSATPVFSMETAKKSSIKPATKKIIKTNTVKPKTQKKDKKDCPPGKVLNTITNRCINKKGALAKKLGLQSLIKTMKKDKKVKKEIKSKTQKQPKKICPHGKVLNPNTGRCIKCDGVTAKKLGLKC